MTSAGVAYAPQAGGLAGGAALRDFALFLHLYHGIGSFFQTMGWNTVCNKPAIETTGKIVSLVLLAGFIAIVFLNK